MSFNHGDLVRPRVPIAEHDHNGMLRTWKPTTILRVLHTTRTQPVRVVCSDDSRGLRVEMGEKALVCHRKAEHTNGRGQ